LGGVHAGSLGSCARRMGDLHRIGCKSHSQLSIDNARRETSGSRKTATSLAFSKRPDQQLDAIRRFKSPAAFFGAAA
jgi:hypothetical protein